MESVKASLKKIPGLQPAYRSAKRLANAVRSTRSPFVRHFPAGHFYSPLPDMAQVRQEGEAPFEQPAEACPGVDLQDEKQLAVLAELARYYDELPFPERPSGATRYYYQNEFFRYADAVVLYGMLRRLRPRRVIEVGSGFSSAVMLDTDEAFLEGQTRFTFIDPHPERLLGLLTERDRPQADVIRQPVQRVTLALFDELEAGDVLFVDSSHVVKFGSDVKHLLSRVLPRLAEGVVVHFHDVFWPFEYPKAWVMAGNAWNEAYYLRAFLQYNMTFGIEYFNAYMAAVHEEAVRRAMPLCMRDKGASLWIRKGA